MNSEEVRPEERWFSYRQLCQRWASEYHTVLRLTTGMAKLRLGNRVRVPASAVYRFERENLVAQGNRAGEQ